MAAVGLYEMVDFAAAFMISDDGEDDARQTSSAQDYLVQAKATLELSPEDEQALRLLIQGMGSPDIGMGETVSVDRKTLTEAAAEPLARGLFGDDVGVFVRTERLPSGRVLQVARRFWGLPRHAMAPDDWSGTAVHVREILLPPSQPVTDQHLVFIDAATVTEFSPEHGI